MKRLDMDEYHHHTREERSLIDAWMLLHWIEPGITTAVEWDTERVVADQIVLRDGLMVINRKRDEIRWVRRGVPLCAPFPVEVAE